MAPARFAVAALGAGAVAAAALGGNRVGLNAVLVAIAVAFAVLLSGRRSGTAWSPVWAVLALLLSTIAALRDAVWVVLPCLVAAAAFGSLAMTGGRTWLGVARGLVGAFRRLPFGPPEVLRSVVAVLPGGSRAAAVPVLRGVVLAVALVALFGALFVSGDAAFAELAEGALPSWRTDVLVAQLFWLVLVTAFCGALVVAGRYAADPDLAEPGRRLSRVEWVPALAALNLLFAAFVAVQATVLFAQDDHVLRTTGLTYAEYAREGFWQLLVAAALTLAVTAGSLRWVRAERRSDDLLLRALLGLLCAFTLVVLASAFHRLDLYQDAFGATRLRVAAEVVMAWLGGGMVLVAVGVATGHYRWMPRVAALLSGLGLLAFGLSDPDRRIAERNVERYAETGKVDAGYLGSLSADAVPAISDLPRAERERALADEVLRLRADESWAELNLARERARDSLAP